MEIKNNFFQDIEIVELKNKGRAVIAKDKFFVGDLLISETPLFRCRIDYVDIKDLEQDIKHELSHLSEEGRKKFFELTDCHTSQSHNEKPSSLGIFQTNAHPCGFDAGNDDFKNISSLRRSYSLKENDFEVSGGAHRYAGILPVICRINHSCCPNATHSWNPKTKQQMIYAAKIIEKGDEITIPYIDQFGNANERFKKLRDTWNFDCTCKACKKPPSESNNRRIQIAKLNDLIYNAISSGKYELGLKFVEKRLQLLVEEGEDTPKEKFKSEWDAFQACCYFKDEKASKAWFKAALRDAILAYGPDYAEKVQREAIAQK